MDLRVLNVETTPHGYLPPACMFSEVSTMSMLMYIIVYLYIYNILNIYIYTVDTIWYNMITICIVLYVYLQPASPQQQSRSICEFQVPYWPLQTLKDSRWLMFFSIGLSSSLVEIQCSSKFQTVGHFWEIKTCPVKIHQDWIRLAWWTSQYSLSCWLSRDFNP